MQIVCELAMATLDAFHANAIRKVNCRNQTGDERDVGRSNVLKAFSLELWLVPSVCGNRVPDFVHDCLVAQIEIAGALGRLQPLVRRRGVEIAPQFVEVKTHHPRDVGAIEGRDDSLRPRHGGNFLCRQYDASHSCDVAYKDDASARSDGIIEAIENLSSA